MEIKSPITGTNNTTLEEEISSSKISGRYKKELGIDVSSFFISTDKVSIYKCLDTGYRFYYPFNIAGDDSFYQKLERFPWYYMDWKWEHTIAEKFTKKGDKVLEVGCAKGDFLKKIKEKGSFPEGLELNSKALQKCRENDLVVYPDSIEKFSENRKDAYDVVCSFQVLEHIPDVKTFLESSIYTVKPGGLIIISVPNNDSFILNRSDIILNMPPHHMGLWNTNSLIKLQNHFPFTLQDLYLEPLQPYHVEYAKKFVEEKLNNKLNEKIRMLKRFIKPFAKRFIDFTVYAHAENIIGQTIVAVYKKT